MKKEESNIISIFPRDFWEAAVRMKWREFHILCTSWSHPELNRGAPDTDGTDGVTFILALVMKGNPNHPQGASR